jgi:uncharacterized NAD-dependent epimerase/dehydratase family protein
MRRIAILAEGAFTWRSAKTATGVIRYGKDRVVAVIDSTRAGQDVSQALQSASFGPGIPIVRDINEALIYQPDTLMIGIAPVGGALPQEWRWQLTTAIEAGLNIISGLHFFIADDEELLAAAEKRSVTIWDVRRPPDRQRVATLAPHRSGSHTILMVGSDCAVGKPRRQKLHLLRPLTHDRGAPASPTRKQNALTIRGRTCRRPHWATTFLATWRLYNVESHPMAYHTQCEGATACGA